ncbi:MAG: fumarylacetoacetate hydrolase family protein [Planctomycetota bacterium]
MKLIRFVDSRGRVQWGECLDARRAMPLVGDLFGEYSLAGEPVDVVRRLAPIDPPNVFAVGRNYREHAAEMSAAETAAADLPAEPLVFLKATTAVIGPDEPIALPRSAPDEVDFEAELAVVIGTAARDVAESRALDHIIGYTCANDVTARDCQKRRDKQWARAKSFDTFCPLGPVIVTRDELEPAALRIRSFLNGETMQDGNTADMLFSVPRLVSYLSHQFTLLPGTVILTGTPAGVGFARNPKVFLKPGDRISVEVEGIERLTNDVIAQS